MDNIERQVCPVGKRLSSDWNRMSNGKKTFLCYTFVFSLVVLIAFSPFIFGGKSFICRFDGAESIYQGLAYTGKWVREIISSLLHGRLEVPLYDLSIGWGGSIISDSLDPLTLVLAPLFPMQFTEVFYTFLLLLRMYLAGLSYLYMCRYFKQERFASLAGCYVYQFSAYAIYSGTAFLGYITPMIQLPLLIVGADRVLNKRSSVGFVFTVWYTALCGYYHLYIQTILLAIYCLVRLFELYPKGTRLKALPSILIHGIGYYLLGLGLSAVILYPAVFGFTSVGRSSFRNLNISGDLSVHWHYFWVRLLSLISPIVRYDWDWGMDYPAFAAVFAVSLVVLFKKGTQTKVTLKWLMGIGLFMLFCPYCGWIMNGFQYACNRWSFGLSLLAGFTITYTLSEILTLDKKWRGICAIVLCVYGSIALFFADMRQAVFASVGMAFFALTLLVLPLEGTNRSRFPRRVLVVILVCANVCVNSLFLCSPESMGWADYFMPIGYQTLKTAVAMEAEPLSTPYGYDINKGRVDSTQFSYCDARLYGLPATTIYTPLLDSGIVDFWIATEGSGNIQYFKIYSTDQRTIENTLLSVNQQFERKGSEQYVPYGYSYCGETMFSSKVYQNDYALPWGYTYDNAVSYDEISRLNGIEAQEAMLQAVALDNPPEDQYLEAIDFESERIPYSYGCLGCQWENGVLEVNDASSIIRLNAQLTGGREYYVRLKGFDINGYGNDYFTISTGASFNFAVQCGDIYKQSRAMDKAYPWYYGRENYLFCLGYTEDDRDTVDIQIPAIGTFLLEDIELYALPLKHYPERAERLRADPLQDVRIGTNEIAGTVDLSKDKILCLSVPYSNGWTAYVDGEAAALMKANYAFIGLPLSGGRHEIVFKYTMPGLKTGILISGISAVVLLLLLLGRRRKRQKEESGSVT